MAENFYASLMGSEMKNATGVAEFLRYNMRPLVSVRAKQGNRSYIDRAIENLEKMKKESLHREEDVYDKLKVKSLEELQSKLDELNKSGLSQFTNKALQRFPAIKMTKGTLIKAKNLPRMIEKDFLEWVNKKFADQELTEGMIEAYFESLGMDSREKAGHKLRTHKRTGKVLGITFREFTQKEKKKIKKIFGAKLLEETKTSLGQNSENLTFSLVVEEDGEKMLKYYPYFGLSEEELREARKDEDLWANFKRAVGQCVRDISLSKQIEEAMEIMRKDSFVSAGTSYGDIVGIFGELQSLVFLRSLNIDTRFVGHAKEEGKKIGIDLVLEGIGFQVKNYNTYGERGISEGIMLRNSYKLSNFLEIITKEGTALAGYGDLLQSFYAASAFHISVHPDFDNIRKWMDHIQTDQLPMMYHGVIAELLPVKQISWIEDNTQFNGTNAFYIIGGTRILPVSKILNLYIKFLKNFKNNLEKPKLLTMGAKGGMSYSGEDTYKDFHENKDKYIFPGYDNIADNIRINYNINLNIDYTIQEILSKMEREGIQF